MFLLQKIEGMMVYHIGYMSRAISRFGHDDLAHLCDRSSERNKKAGITGLLVHDGRRFMQVIEGDTDAVRELMARIVADTRHDKIAYIAVGHQKERNFDGWALACVGFEKNMTAAELLADVTALICGIADPKLMAAFIGFARSAR